MVKRRSLARVIAFVMLASSVVVAPMKVDATEVGSNIREEVYYNEELEIEDYWTTKTAPVEEGYIFGGWFTKKTEGGKSTYTALKEADLQGKDLTTFNDVCAKFVPSYVLSVKAQLEKATEENNGTNAETTYMRVITALDSNEYQQVNFEIWYNNTIEDTEVPDIKKVYSSIKNADGDLAPQTEFGTVANYFGVLKLTDIWDDNYGKIIYVRPSWTTMDGTKVEGLGKYIRVEDGFQKYQYLSIPINFLKGNDVAAGTLEMSYDANTLAFVDWDCGRLLPEMECHVDETTGTIRFVGNEEGTKNNGEFVNVTPDGIFANLRFKRKNSDTTPAKWDFNVINEKFCNWSKAIVEDVAAWDVRYY